jgi:hypothetical protein
MPIEFLPFRGDYTSVALVEASRSSGSGYKFLITVVGLTSWQAYIARIQEVNSIVRAVSEINPMRFRLPGGAMKSEKLVKQKGYCMVSLFLSKMYL